jgi:hypothetical protein
MGLRKYKSTGQYHIGGSFSVLGTPLLKALPMNQTNRPELIARARYQYISECGAWRITTHTAAKRTKPTIGQITEFKVDFMTLAPLDAVLLRKLSD